MKKITLIGFITLTIGIIVSMVGFSRIGFNAQNINNEFSSIIQSAYGNEYNKQLPTFDRIKVSNQADVTVKYGDRYEVIGKDAKGRHTNYQVKNNQLLVNNKGKSNNHINIIGFESAQYDAKITIVIPKGTVLQNYQQNNSNSDLEINGIKIANRLNLSDIGDVKLNDVTARGITIDSSDSDVSISDSKFDQNPSKFHSDDGDVDIHNSKFKALDVSTEDGDISLSNNYIYQGISHINSSDGDVTLGTNSWKQLVANSEDGDISFAHQTIKKALSVTTDDGDIKGSVYKTDDAHITSDTDDGDKSIDKSINNSNGKKPYYLKSVDGDIDIYS